MPETPAVELWLNTGVTWGQLIFALYLVVAVVTALFVWVLRLRQDVRGLKEEARESSRRFFDIERGLEREREQGPNIDIVVRDYERGGQLRRVIREDVVAHIGHPPLVEFGRIDDRLSAADEARIEAALDRLATAAHADPTVLNPLRVNGADLDADGRELTEQQKRQRKMAGLDAELEKDQIVSDSFGLLAEALKK